MRKVLILHSNMELGGAETSLIGLLHSIDYSQYSVDLVLQESKGELLSLIPKQVNLLPTMKSYKCLALPIKDVLFKMHAPGIALARLLGRMRGSQWPDKTYSTKQFAQFYSLPFLPQFPGEYDMAISFIDPHYIVVRKTHAKVSLGWLHTDFSRIHPDSKLDKSMWDSLDYIVNISEACKEKFDASYPELASKSIVVENILSKGLVEQRAFQQDVTNEFDLSATCLLSIGRFSEAKNFDNVPAICQYIRKKGLNVKWYLIGYGSEEGLIRQKIVEYGMEDYVVILGKKDNPYPYIRACNLYVQPSRYEGNCVSVREAQILRKPVVITRYSTSSSQLEDGIDGKIVPMDNKGCADGIVALLNDPKQMEQFSINCSKRDYSNSEEIEKLYKIIDEL